MIKFLKSVYAKVRALVVSYTLHCLHYCNHFIGKKIELNRSGSKKFWTSVFYEVAGFGSFLLAMLVPILVVGLCVFVVTFAIALLLGQTIGMLIGMLVGTLLVIDSIAVVDEAMRLKR